MSRRPKSAGNPGMSRKSKSQSSLHHAGDRRPATTPHTARAHGVRRQRSSSSLRSTRNDNLIPFRSRRRHPRIDDAVKRRYPEWRMQGRSEDVYGMSKLSPGPIYIPKDSFVLPETPKWSLGQLISDKSSRMRSPGPIYNPKYQYTHYHPPSFSLIARRPHREFNQTTPAPNQYDVNKSKLLRSSREYTLKGRVSKRSDTLSDTPGPSAYDVSKSLRKHSVPSTKIAKRLPDMTQNYLNTVPGPAHYMPLFKQTMHRSSTWTMGKRFKVIDSRDENPGPGHYGPPLIAPYKRKKKKKRRA